MKRVTMSIWIIILAIIFFPFTLIVGIYYLVCLIKEYPKYKNSYFDRRKRNIESAKRLNVLPAGFDVDKYINEGTGNLKLLEVGDVFDLGDVDLEVIKMEGHTPGSIGLYIKKWKLMLVSDAACPFVWLFLEESLPLSTYDSKYQ